MPIDIRIVKGRDDSETFVRLPLKLYRGWRNFVPPLLKDERMLYDSKFNSSLQCCETVRFLAFENGQPVGRITGIIHHRYNHTHGDNDCRFFQFDCIDNQETADLLLNAVCQWGAALGAQRMIGPFGFSDKDPQGIQIMGSKSEPVIASASNPSYIENLIERFGCTKFKDCVSYLIGIPQKLPSSYQKICQRLNEGKNYEVVSFEKRSDLKPHFRNVLLLLNEGYENIYGFMPLSDEDIQRLADEYLDFINPRFVKFIRKADDHEIIAFVLAMPNLAEGFRKAKGRLFPFGFLHLLKCLKFSKKLDLLLGAVHPRHQGKGLTAILAAALLEEASNAGMVQLDSHLILEENLLMRAEMKRLGADVTKRYRIYQKHL